MTNLCEEGMGDANGFTSSIDVEEGTLKITYVVLFPIVINNL